MALESENTSKFGLLRQKNNAQNTSEQLQNDYKKVKKKPKNGQIAVTNFGKSVDF